MTKKALVTGSKGFIGCHLCRLLQERGYAIRVLNRHVDKRWPDAVSLDLSSTNWGTNPCNDIDVIFHLAGKAHDLVEMEQDLKEYWRINTEGTKNLLMAAQKAGVQRFIFFSSVKAVGDCDPQPMNEMVTVSTNTPYGKSKYEAEQLVLHGGYIPQPIVLRPCMVYGNSHKGNLPRMINAIRKGIFPPLPTNQNKRSMVHVEDVVRAAILAAENPKASGQIYIVSDGQAYSTRQIYDWIRKDLGKPVSRGSIPVPILHIIAIIGDLIGKMTGRRFIFNSYVLQKLIGSAWYSSDRIARELGFVPKHSLKKSLPDIIRYLD